MKTETKVKSINSIADLVLDDRVHKSLYSDKNIFEEELEKIFNNTWVHTKQPLSDDSL
jgi:hypothetical protein